jgi:hypothetical protein
MVRDELAKERNEAGSSSSTTTTSSKGLDLGQPEAFSGSPHKLDGFLQECRLHFVVKPEIFLTEARKVSVQFGSELGEKINPRPDTDRSPDTGTHRAGWLLIYHGVGIGCWGQQREPGC